MVEYRNAAQNLGLLADKPALAAELEYGRERARAALHNGATPAQRAHTPAGPPGLQYPLVRTAETGTTGSTVHCSQRRYGMVWCGRCGPVRTYCRSRSGAVAALPLLAAPCCINTDTYTAGCCRRIAAAVFRLYRCAKSVVVHSSAL